MLIIRDNNNTEIARKMSLVIQNLKTVGGVVAGCNLVGYIITAALETHKLTDLVGVGSFFVASAALIRKTPISNTRSLLINSAVMLWGARLCKCFFRIM